MDLLLNTKLMKKLLSIVIPAYNEEKNIPLIYQELRKVLEKVFDKYDYEIIFVNDGSKDNTWEEIVKLAKKDKKVKGINFSRNFGKEDSIDLRRETVVKKKFVLYQSIQKTFVF